MTKLTRKQKIQLAMESKKIKEDIRSDSDVKNINLISIIKHNYVILASIILLCLVVYFNSLNNELTLVDDIQGFVYDERIKDLPATLKTLVIQKIVYALSYKLFEYSPLPLRIISVFLHILVAVMVFLLMYIIFGKKLALISTLIFAVHPINTEAVTWISGVPYLYITFFMFIIFLLYLFYKLTNKKRYIIIASIVYVITLFIIQTPWVLVTPMAVVILDQFFLEKKINFASLWWIFLFTIPVTIYLVTYFTTAFQGRLEYRSGQGGRVTTNAQSLKPVIEGYPYTILEMVKLYVFPKDLTVYYDGTKVTKPFYVSMYIAFFLYIFLTFYFWKKHRVMAGIFIILPILIAPTLSPIKVTWFLAERYLYPGTAFFGLAVGYGLEYLQKKYRLNHKHIWVILGIIVTLFSIRTIYRNMDWQDTETLSFANMKTSPLSVRPYNDLAGHYYYKNKIEMAIEYYEKGLEIVPTSGTAISNLGYIYLERGPLIFMTNYYVKFNYDPELAKVYFDYAIEQAKSSGDQKIISYFLNKALAYQPDNVYYMENLADFYNSRNLMIYARDLYMSVLKLDPTDERAKQKLSVLETLIESGAN